MGTLSSPQKQKITKARFSKQCCLCGHKKPQLTQQPPSQGEGHRKTTLEGVLGRNGARLPTLWPVSGDGQEPTLHHKPDDGSASSQHAEECREL